MFSFVFYPFHTSAEGYWLAWATKNMPTRCIPYIWLSGGLVPFQITNWGLVVADLKYFFVSSLWFWTLEVSCWDFFNIEDAKRTLYDMLPVGISILLVYLLTPRDLAKPVIDFYTQLESYALDRRERLLLGWNFYERYKNQARRDGSASARCLGHVTVSVSNS